ncbi:hypothetical protein VE01_05590 [Pseudogymnoascus verrucosus]|uniref:Uncharacterized protein n=1 Tax=Pseudogymnoascus verrucosus TaxID=342668 RepID=A0A1B8GKS5_9PEZI|nr:uncharacterized protein VE01_05590 [Pseudogymnoascus verrucosus]OBT96437.2 hypothetical protein VE01_05590 [Pseudogymnoascus verrucosus]
MSAAETLRAREVYRYYQPRNIPESSVESEYSADNGPLSPSHAPPKDTNFDTQKSFSDTALTAFAQLIALRLDSQRAIVSLIDHENEYFLAESTSNLSLVGDDGHAQNASLSISGARVPRAASLCEQTLCLVPNQDTAAEMTPVFLVPDLLLDENTSQLDCVKGAPYLRFYCGVALTNKRGVNIGCVYVVDDRPRTDFSLEQAQFLTTMAATVMDHLENIRAKEDIVRVTMMSQALHAFVEGEGTMDGDWQRVKKYNLPAGAGVGFLWESNTNDVDASVSTESANSATETLMSQTQSPLQHSSNNPDARFNFNNSPWSSSSSQVPTLKSVFEGADDVARKITSGKDAAFSNDGFSNQLRTTFSRASNLIREGMEVDGAVFFDAPFRFYQGRSTLETDPRRLEGKDSESSSDDEVRPGPRPRVQRLKRDANHSNEGATKLKSDVLGYSTRETSSWADQTTGSDASFTAIDQSLLTSLVRHYPLGELFVFDENGPVMRPADIPSPDGSQVTIKNASFDAKLARHNARKRSEILRLLKAFPGARQIFFVPLYDSTSGCFVGSFAWSTSATRIFSIENHLSYLIAFGHSVMSEVTRLNTMSADLAKDDFISNVSHELRSPLHGILASVEFLADTVLDGFQRNLVDTVDICGRTLLDTIEHVLDFSKIKKFGQVSTQPMGSVANLDVSAIIEEVLDGVFAGFEFNGLSSQGLADTTKSRMRESLNSRDTDTKAMDELQFDFSNDALTVIIDIDFRDDWHFPTVPGTWRRLTMNLFGNSLKYTSDGYIKVKLEARSIPSVNPSVNSDSFDRTMITMTVSDSGQGMSSEFMKTKLFMPFTQENVTAPGTGLGMSIVKQIVDLSGGVIEVHSDLGKGTEMKLSLPLDDRLRRASESPELMIPTPEDSISAVRRRARGRTVTIRGFDNTAGKSDLQIEAITSLKASIVKYAEEWFNLKVNSDNSVADIVISDESEFLKSTKLIEGSSQLLLILCSNGARRGIYTSQFEVGQLVEFISKPCGPHRLAKALLNILDAEDALKKSKADHAIQAEPQVGLVLPVVSPQNTRARETAEPRPAFIHRMSSNVAVRLNSSDVPSENALSELLKGTLISESAGVTESPPVPLEPPKMLLVEDNPVNMMLLATYMKRNGWDYEEATNGLIALQAFQNRPQGFDVIFMDVSMPIMTGYESTRKIRAVEAERRAAYGVQLQSLSSPPTPTSPPAFPFPTPGRVTDQLLPVETPLLQPIIRPALVIALTGFSSQNDQEMAFDSGMDIFMTKPVRFRDVGSILEGWMKSREERSS